MKSDVITIYTLCTINAPSNVGLYKCRLEKPRPEDSYESLSDMLQQCDGHPLALDEALEDQDFVDVGIENIRGLIYDEPTHLFASLDHDGITYFGVQEYEVPGDFFDLKISYENCGAQQEVLNDVIDDLAALICEDENIRFHDDTSSREDIESKLYDTVAPEIGGAWPNDDGEPATPEAVSEAFWTAAINYYNGHREAVLDAIGAYESEEGAVE